MGAHRGQHSSRQQRDGGGRTSYSSLAMVAESSRDYATAANAGVELSKMDADVWFPRGGDADWRRVDVEGEETGCSAAAVSKGCPLAADGVRVAQAQHSNLKWVPPGCR